ncbi:undecaprenyl-diphosphatase [Aneurinibacillus terranovensis]|uniref:undecaprenyl-diphosphatase n=1 Tax=Aneurinibacillus terranovensis TaxID=278991 RepID=UPI0004258357|nr:undecaprenyl-diphosphatase [Aneurinibacillus terranovensis]
MDYHLFMLINGLAGKNSITDGIMKGFTSYGPYVFALILLVMIVFSKSKVVRIAGLIGGVSGVIGLGANFIIGHIFYRSRPFITHHVHLLLSHAPDSSFPSDHTTGAFAITFALWRFNSMLGKICLFISIMIGISRIFVGHHYPTDVIGGFVVGAISAQITLQVFSNLMKRRKAYLEG